jgi:hypothetical protein
MGLSSTSELGTNELINNDDMGDNIRTDTDNGYSDPMNIFEDYMSRTSGYDKNVSTDINDEKYKQYLNVLKEGRSTVYKIININNNTDNSNKNQIFNLNLNDLSIQNFGPYGGEQVSYPLSRR